jgi:hypothetical protein
MRYGYYLAADGTMHGDAELGAQAKEMWLFYAGPPYDPKTRTGAMWSRTDGLSIFEGPDGRLLRRMVVVDFFSAKFAAKTMDDGWPYPIDYDRPPGGRPRSGSPSGAQPSADPRMLAAAMSWLGVAP